jgi:hypothetical protein
MSSKTLAVVLHGMESHPQRFAALKRHVLTCTDADVKIPPLPLAWTSFADPLAVVARVQSMIDDWWETGAYNRVLLIGHSCGAVLARKIYICACGNRTRAPLEHELREQCSEPRAWAKEVDRIVLLAGMNNGWSVDYHMSLPRGLFCHLGVSFARVVHFFRRRWPFIFHMRRGAPFLTQLRLQWLAMRASVSVTGVGNAPVVQLLGTIDDLVSPRDNVDLVTGQDFYFLDVPASGHADVIEMDDSPAGQVRSEVLRKALTMGPLDLTQESVPLAEVNPVVQRPDVQDVVFVMHGIRDEGFWTDRVARAVVVEGKRRGRTIARVTATYGYFGMLPFLFPWVRMQKVEWLMNQYAEAMAKYPNATRFHYVGHSNGTWLLASALKNYPCCQFHHIVLAGSVVSSRYDWAERLSASPPQVEAVVNYVATADWVVACFPNVFEFVPIQDLGGAGHWGFPKSAGVVGEAAPVRNIEYVVGRHSAALQERNWEAIARFIVDGQWPPMKTPSPVALQKRHARLVGILGWAPVLVWMTLFLLIGILPARLALGLQAHGWPEWLITLGATAYCAAVIFVAKRL